MLIKNIVAKVVTCRFISHCFGFLLLLIVMEASLFLFSIVVDFYEMLMSFSLF